METVTLTLSAQELAVLGQALELLPYGKAAPVVASIGKQVEQQKAASQGAALAA